MRRSSFTRSIHLCALFGISVGVMLACSSEKFVKNPIALPGSGRPTVAVKSAPATTVEQKKDDDVKAEEPPQPLNISSNGSEAPQRKNFNQLVQSYSNCIGAATATPASPDLQLLLLNQNMIVRTFEDLPPGSIDPSRPPPQPSDIDQSVDGGKKIRFLTKQYLQSASETKSILELEREYLEVTTGRTSTYADTLEDEIYLKSLLTVANVAAFNCDVESPNSRCYCATRESASSLLKRCLPQFSPESEAFQNVLNEMVSKDNCGSEKAIDRRKAIASLLSSYAFAMAK